MLFSSTVFLYAFLPITLLLYFIAPKKARNAVLLLASLVFYFFGERVFTLLLLFSSVSDWTWSLLIEKYRGTKKAKVFLIISIVINLGLLGFFKYTDFFIGTINGIFHTAIPLTGVELPIGISFYTFQTMSYTIDVYRGNAHAQKNLLNMATFVCLFPQLIAGPIVRYTDLASELENRQSTLTGVSEGLCRFALGLGKKVLLANAMGELCDNFRGAENPSVALYWIAAIAYSLQIYLDFSAYSDMAIGLGKVFGFKFPENFDYPFMSQSITEFWRRWHMTLGSWFRDYVYFPLGGSRTTTAKWLRNIAVVWLLTGLWHGAAWNFVLWGVYFGVLLCFEKLFLKKILDKVGAIVRHIYVIFAVIVSFVIFSASGLSGVINDLSGMFGVGGVPFINAESSYIIKSFAVLLVICIFASMPYAKRLTLKVGSTKVGAAVMTVAQPVTVALLLVCCTASLVDGSFNPFLYFRF